MSAALIERLRKNRESKVEAGGHVFIVRRPTDLEWAELDDSSTARALMKHIVGWEGVTELDLYAGGAGHPVPFDAALAQEWLADRPDLLVAVSRAVVDAYRTHVEKQGAARKN